MNIAELNTRIVIQHQKNVRGTDGIVKKEWVDFVPAWAAREPMSGREYFKAAAVQAEKTVRFRIRYRTGITEAMRVLCKGRSYKINAVLDDVKGDRTETHLMTEEVSPGG